MFRRLLLLNGLATFGVATYHAAAYGFDALFEWTNRYRPVAVPNFDAIGSPSYYFLLLIRQLDSYVIPSFIFVTGAFVGFALSKPQFKSKWKIVKTRIGTLIFPLIIWTILRYVLLGRLPSSLHEIFLTYYFLVLVIQFYLLAPLIVPFTQRNWMAAVVAAALINIVSEGLFFLDGFGMHIPSISALQPYFPLWFFPRRVFWFVFGIAAYLYKQPFGNWLVRIRWPLLVVLIVLGLMAVVEYEVVARMTGQSWMGPTFRGFASRLFALFFILTFLSLGDLTFPFSNIFELLGSRSLGIYLANIPSIYVIAVFIYHQTPGILGIQFIYQLILVAAGLLIPLLLMNITRKSPLRRTYRYLFG